LFEFVVVIKAGQIWDNGIIENRDICPFSVLVQGVKFGM
jgi:hypothetical protein